VRFLIDQQLPRRLARWIESQGHEAAHVRELGMENASDADIWRTAIARRAAIVTKDEDFSIVARVAEGPQVVWIRLGNCGNDHLIARVAQAWPLLIAELSQGAAMIEVR
jgi:predicted nuclease of predicted toxin-antitoxin system